MSSVPTSPTPPSRCYCNIVTLQYYNIINGMSSIPKVFHDALKVLLLIYYDIIMLHIINGVTSIPHVFNVALKALSLLFIIIVVLL